MEMYLQKVYDGLCSIGMFVLKRVHKLECYSKKSKLLEKLMAGSSHGDFCSLLCHQNVGYCSNHKVPKFFGVKKETNLLSFNFVLLIEEIRRSPVEGQVV